MESVFEFRQSRSRVQAVGHHIHHWPGQVGLTAASPHPPVPWPGLPLTLQPGSISPVWREHGVGISIAELLASGDKALSVLSPILWPRSGSRCSHGYFWKYCSFFFILPKSDSSGIFFSEGDFGSSAYTIRHFSRLIIFQEVSSGLYNFRKNLNIGRNRYLGIHPQLCLTKTRWLHVVFLEMVVSR